MKGKSRTMGVTGDYKDTMEFVRTMRRAAQYFSSAAQQIAMAQGAILDSGQPVTSDHVEGFRRDLTTMRSMLMELDKELGDLSTGMKGIQVVRKIYGDKL